MMPLALAFVLQATPLAATPLWREFHQGMTPEQFADALRKVEGIAKVELVRKGSKLSRIKVTYANGSGVVIGAMTVTVSPIFKADALTTITLAQTSCYSAITAALPATLSALADKYPQRQRVRVVDEQGVPIDTEQAFNNGETRVTVSVTPIENPYPQHLYGGSGIVAALNKLSNSMADDAYNKAIEACPTDRGRKATLALEYSSQLSFAADHAEQEREREAKDRAVKEGL